MAIAELSESADPRKPQRRIATTPSGRTVWVEITSDDRLRLIKQLPHRWPEVIMARERGEPLEHIARWAKVPGPCNPCRLATTKVVESDPFSPAEQTHVGPACLAFYMGRIYAWLETELHAIAQNRARLMV